MTHELRIAIGLVLFALCAASLGGIIGHHTAAPAADPCCVESLDVKVAEAGGFPGGLTCTVSMCGDLTLQATTALPESCDPRL